MSEKKKHTPNENEDIEIRIYQNADILDEPLVQEAIEEWHQEPPRISGMIICETQFEHEDKNNKGYSMTEIDIYAWIPKNFQRKEKIPDHRLSLRRNLTKNVYEVYRHYWLSKTEEIIFATASLAEALKHVDAEWNHFHFKWSNTVHKDSVCDHKTNRASGCQINYMDLFTPPDNNRDHQAEI